MSKKRFDHTLLVAKYAKKLAKIYKENINDAETAGMLHDIAREWDFNDILKFIDGRKITVSDEKRNNPILLHGFVASVIAKEEFGISNQGVINAIANHTLGSKNMGQLEEIIFLADYLASRNGTDIGNKIFKIAGESLDKAVLMVYELNFEYLTKENSPIAKEFYENWEYYKQFSK